MAPKRTRKRPTRADDDLPEGVLDAVVAPPPEPAPECPAGHHVGRRMRHYWAGDNAWYFGRILTYDVETKLHLVLYDDGELHECNLDGGNELYMVAKDCYVVKLSGHSAWPAMEWTCCEALTRAGTVPMWNACPPTKIFIVFFGTEEQGCVPKPDAPGAPKKKKAGDRSTGASVKPYGPSGHRHSNITTALNTRGPKARELAAALAMADAEILACDEQRRAWGRGEPLPAGLPVHKYDANDEDANADYALLAAEDVGGGHVAQAPAVAPPVVAVAKASKARADRRKAAPAPCAHCGGGDMNLLSDAAQCTTCGKCYHLRCWGGPELQRAPLSIKKGPPWACADCLKCAACDRTQRQVGPFSKVKREKVGDRMELLCRDCSEVYKSGRYCPACHAMWEDDDPSMVQCDQCKLWTHAACAGISEEELKTIQDGTHEELGRQYLCAGAGCAVRVTTRVVNALSRCDTLGLFIAPVDAAAVPGYSDVVKHPMDLSTMKVKAEEGKYRATQPIRDDCELMVHNAVRFNRAGDKVWKEAMKFHAAATKLFDEMRSKDDGRPRNAPSKHCAGISASREGHRAKLKTEREARTQNVVKDRVTGSAVQKTYRVERAPPRDPVSACAAVELSLAASSDADRVCWQDLCFVCGAGEVADPLDRVAGAPKCLGTALTQKPKRGGGFLYCADCGECYHGMCASAPIDAMAPWAKASWRCPNCKVCETCGVNKDDDDAKLLYCDSCDKAYHLSCVSPALTAAPPGRWLCDLCVECKLCAKPNGWSSRADRCRSCATISRPLRGQCGALQHCAVVARGGAGGPAGAQCVYCGVVFHGGPCAQMHLKPFDGAPPGTPPGCARCRAEAVSVETHLGTGDGAWRLALAASRVQRRRADAKRGASTSTALVVARPLRGSHDLQAWGGRAELAAAHASVRGGWRDVRVCALCHVRGDCPDAGRLVPVRDAGEHLGDRNDKSAPMAEGWVHANCALWSSEVYELERLLVHVAAAVRRSRTLKCTHCGETGATMGCCGDGCKRNYHFRCGAYAGAVCVAGARVFCPECWGGKDLAGDRRKKNNERIQKAHEAATVAARAAAALAGRAQPAGASIDVGSVVEVGGLCDGEARTRRVGATATVTAIDSRGSFLVRYADGEAHACSTGLLLPAPPPGASPAVTVPVPPDVPQEREGPRPPPGLVRPLSHYLGDVPIPVRVLSSQDAAAPGHDAYDHAIEERRKQAQRRAEAAARAAGKPPPPPLRPAAPAPAERRPARQRKRSAAAVEADDDDGLKYIDDEAAAKKARSRKKANEAKLKREQAQKSKRLEAADAQHHAWLDDRVLRTRSLADYFRVGALTLHAIGAIAPASYVGFHAPDRVYPLGYRATRIFWSFVKPLARTLYVCEVVAATTIVDKKPVKYARFRVTAADAPRMVIDADDPGSAVAQVRARVAQAGAEGCWKLRARGGRHARRVSMSSYGLGDDGGGFFGFAIPAVRARCEDLPGAVGLGLCAELASDDDRRRVQGLAAVRGAPRALTSYRFAYVRPAQADVLAAQRAAAQRAAAVRPNPSGAARLEARDAVTDTTERNRVTRALARAQKEREAREAEEAEKAKSSKKEAPKRARYTAGAMSSAITTVELARERYRKMKAVPVLERVAARRSHIHGWGLYLKQDVRRDDFIIEYVGQVVRQCVGDRREKYYDESGVGSCYLFRLDEDAIVDATRRGHVGRFINHCCKPNAYAKIVALDALTKKIVIIALQDLKAGDEVMYDYKFPIEDEKIKCYCGAPNCKGTMN